MSTADELDGDELPAAIADGIQPDPRLTFLLRAAAKLILVESCHQDLDTAFADLVPAFRAIAVPPCQCEREMLEAWARYDRRPAWSRRRA